MTVKEKADRVLIPDWRAAWRLWSVRLGAVATALGGLFLVAPEAALQLWQMVPAEARSILPLWVVKGMPIALWVAALAARLIKQKAWTHGT